MKIQTNTIQSLEVADQVDSDGDLLIMADGYGSESVWLTASQQDALISHLIEVRGAGRIQALLRNPFDGNVTKQITEL